MDDTEILHNPQKRVKTLKAQEYQVAGKKRKAKPTASSHAQTTSFQAPSAPSSRVPSTTASHAPSTRSPSPTIEDVEDDDFGIETHHGQHSESQENSGDEPEKPEKDPQAHLGKLSYFQSSVTNND